MTQDAMNTDNTVNDDTNNKMDGLKPNTNTHNDNNTTSKENVEEMSDSQQKMIIRTIGSKTATLYYQEGPEPGSLN